MLMFRVINANQTGSITESGTSSFEIIDGRYIKCGNVVFCSVRGEFKTNTSSGGAFPLVRVPFNPSYPSAQFGVVSVATVSSADGARTIASTVTLAAPGSNYYAYQGVTTNLRAGDVISMLWMYYV